MANLCWIFCVESSEWKIYENHAKKGHKKGDFIEFILLFISWCNVCIGQAVQKESFYKIVLRGDNCMLLAHRP